MIPIEVKRAYDTEVRGGWAYLSDTEKDRLERAWAHHDRCEVCRGNGWTKAEIHMPTPNQLQRLAADPVLAEMQIPICKQECPRCQGLGVIYGGAK